MVDIFFHISTQTGNSQLRQISNSKSTNQLDFCANMFLK